MINIGLLGFGKTGQLVADEILKEESTNLQWVIRKSKKDNHDHASSLLGYKNKSGCIFSKKEASKKDFLTQNKVDVIIDFSSSESIELYDRIAENGIKIISAISHYTKSELETLKKMGLKTAFLYSPNITLGVNFLIIASSLLQKIAPEADIEIVESHFREKQGVSGTALKIAEKLKLDSKKHVNSIRAGGIVGKHEIIFGLPDQVIRLTHESINRRAFGSGAIFAAKWLIDKKPGYYSMEEIIREKFINNIAVNELF